MDFPLLRFLERINGNDENGNNILLKIRKEVTRGENKNNNEDDEEIEIDIETEIANIKAMEASEMKTTKRKNSNTLHELLNEFKDVFVCPIKSSPFSCFLNKKPERKSFFRQFVSDLDMGDGNGQEWNDQQYERFKKYLGLLQSFLMNVNRITSASFRNSFTDAMNILRTYFHEHYDKDEYNKIIEFAGKILKSDWDIVKLQLVMKRQTFELYVKQQV